MSTTIAARLAELGVELPPVATPVAAYVPAVVTGNLVYTAGQVPFVDGKLPTTGKVGGEVTAEDAAALARICALNALAAIDQAVGSLDRVTRIVRVGVFVSSTTDFFGQAGVANGASEFLGEVFGDAGKHARTAIGVPVLPLNAPVEVDIIAEFA